MSDSRFIAVPVARAHKRYVCTSCGNNFWLFDMSTTGSLLKRLTGEHATGWPDEIAWICDGCTTMKQITAALAGKEKD